MPQAKRPKELATLKPWGTERFLKRLSYNGSRKTGCFSLLEEMARRNCKGGRHGVDVALAQKSAYVCVREEEKGLLT